MAWNTPTTWVAGAVLTAAQLNDQLRDNFKAIGDPWTTYAPTWASSGGTQPAVGNGSLTGAYMRAGKLLSFRITLSMGTTTTYGTGTYQFTMPAAPLAHRWAIEGFARDDSASGALFPVRAFWDSTNNVAILRTWPTTAGAALVPVTATVPFAFANLDSISLSGTLELA